MSEETLAWRITKAFITGPLVEVTVPKPGNVSRLRDLSDLSFYSFLFAETSVMDVYYNVASGRIKSVGTAIELAVMRSKEAQMSNPNFGIVALSVPLMMALARTGRRRGAGGMASSLIEASKPEDSVSFYRAIRMASPKGLHKGVRYDVHSKDSTEALLRDGINLRRLAEMSCGRELIFCEWLSGYRLTEKTARRLEGLLAERTLEEAVLEAFLKLMAEVRDTLIERRAGRGVAEKVRRMAWRVLEGEIPIERLDSFLSGDERRNPGSLADITAVALSLVLFDGYHLDGNGRSLTRRYNPESAT